MYKRSKAAPDDDEESEDSEDVTNDPDALISDMRRDGLAFKQSVLGRRNNTTAYNQVIDLKILLRYIGDYFENNDFSSRDILHISRTIY